jgi:hypothetical protein
VAAAGARRRWLDDDISIAIGIGEARRVALGAVPMT